jgi:hypothetical protein
MRRRILTILLAAVVVAVVVPFGAAFTFDARFPMRTPGAELQSRMHRSGAPGFPEAGSLVLAGGVLIGLAVAVRRIS